MTKNILIEDAIKICLERHIPFCCFRMPFSDKLTMIVQNNAECDKYTSVSHIINNPCKGFVAVPFDKGPVLFLREDFRIETSASKETAEFLLKSKFEVSEKQTEPGTSCMTKTEYLQRAGKFIDKIKNGEVDKLVFARPLATCREGADLLAIFKQLSDKYPETFVYWLNVPSECIWIGATPECFLKREKSTINTVALAGTTQTTDSIKWSDKNKREQNFVTDFLTNIFNEAGCISWKKSQPHTVKAGALSHIRTDFCATVPDNFDIAQLIEKMHPTPAVCGTPKDVAKKIIIKGEGFDREYYSGIIGTTDGPESLDLFVNLRCMKVQKDKFVLFAGGGITSESTAEDEWNETELKAQTLLSVIKNIKQNKPNTTDDAEHR